MTEQPPESTPPPAPTRPRSVVRRVLRDPGQPPELTRAEAIRTGALVAFGIGVAAFFLLCVADFDIQGRKVRQKLERVASDLFTARGTLDAWHQEHGAFPEPDADGALPAAFSEFDAARRGGKPLHQEQGRLLRLDLFGPTDFYKDPLRYLLHGDTWILVSRGPDQTFAIDAAAITRPANEWRAHLMPLTYDPTNGADSPGDLWISNAP